MRELAREVLAGEEAWIVGGAVRDKLLGRETDDIDLAVPGDPKPYARKLSRAVKGAAFELSGAFGAWRRLYTPLYHTPLELGALYWHLVDIVWIFLWPCLYLMRQ